MAVCLRTDPRLDLFLMKASNKAEKALVDLLVKVLMRELEGESQQGTEKT